MDWYSEGIQSGLRYGIKRDIYSEAEHFLVVTNWRKRRKREQISHCKKEEDNGEEH